METCVFCLNGGPEPFYAGGKPYWQCPDCGGIYLDRAARPDPEAEKIRYEAHNNSALDPAFRAYLARFIDPVLETAGAVRTVFDYGSGPEPVLSTMLSERGYDVRLYDPYFAPDTVRFPAGADLVVCHEVAEHFFEPRVDFALMADCVAPGGFLAVGTKLLPDGGDCARVRERFSAWWYREDSTHVSFYTERALDLCARSAALESVGRAGNDCLVFRKPCGNSAY